MTKTFAATAALMGTIIGAGILGIPFVVMKSGFFPGIFNIIILGTIIIFVSLCLGEITLRTKSDHQLTGYAEKYLGKKGKILMFIASGFGIYSAILAYLIGESESLSFLFFETASYQIPIGIAFWLFLSILSYFGLKTLERGEETGLILIIIFLISIILTGWNKIDIHNLSYTNYQHFFTPFGVVLFAFLSFSAIPEIKRILKNKQLTKRLIISAYIFTIIIYIIFTFLVLGIKGQNTPQIATLALGKPFILLGIVTMFTAYFALSTALIDTLKLDLDLTKNKSWFIAVSIPLIFFIILKLINSANFIEVIGIGGAISGSLTAILILIMHHKSKFLGDRHPEYSLPNSKFLSFILVLIFFIGMLMEIINILQ